MMNEKLPLVFNSIEFVLFFAVVVIGYYALQFFVQLFVRHTRLQYSQLLCNLFLLAASYFFYLYAAPTAVVFMIASTLLTYGSGLLAQKLSGARIRKAALVITIIATLSFLIVFKYTVLFVDILRLFGISQMESPALIAPIGISFYTFQTLGYIIDVYRKKAPAERNIVTYALFFSFFPHITMGPIARANQLLPQFQDAHPLKYTNLLYGAQRFVWGLFKKAVVADWLGIIVNGIYSDLQSRTGIVFIAAAILFALQLYFDFSAYMDMALGVAKMLGFTLLENFQTPYYATNMTGFWKRWHISLTSWLTDYIFTPLVWSRWVNKLFFGKKWNDHAPHFAANILLVFVISGLWHGSTINFIVWGALHGLFRLTEELFHKIKQPAKIQNKWLRGFSNAYKRLLVFCLWACSLVFFKLPTIRDALYVVSNMFTSLDWMNLVNTIYRIVNANIASNINFISFILIVIGASILLVGICDYFIIYKTSKKRDNPGNVLQHLSFVPRWLCYFFIIAATVAVGVFGASGFVYYQF